VVVLAGTFLLSYVIVRWVGTQVDVE